MANDGASRTAFRHLLAAYKADRKAADELAHRGKTCPIQRPTFRC